ncbi:MAG: hypothetical protein QG635_827, partial [Bacteroidota bacterium]|nr:hypothetical protein [Bacteroidota bacterium]
GVASRGHRILMLTPEFKYAGIAFGYHSIYQYMCVIDCAGSYKEQ